MSWDLSRLALSAVRHGQYLRQISAPRLQGSNHTSIHISSRKEERRRRRRKSLLRLSRLLLIGQSSRRSR
jgi:hypothetical protein